MMNTTKNIIAIAAIAAASFAGTASAADEPPEVWFGAEPVAAGPPLSRAEVLADLALWNRAGLNNYYYQLGEFYNFDAEYQQRLAQYQKMRSGPEFQEEVRRQGGAAQ